MSYEEIKAISLNMEGVELLTRAQLKNVMGGTELPGTTPSGGVRCSTSSFQLVVQEPDGSWTTHNGGCSQSYEFCYCNAGLTVVIPTSNGAISRCTL